MALHVGKQHAAGAPVSSDLGFPEFTRYVRGLDTELATAILHDYPTAAAFHGLSVRRLAALRYDKRQPGRSRSPAR